MGKTKVRNGERNEKKIDKKLEKNIMLEICKKERGKTISTGGNVTSKTCLAKIPSKSDTAGQSERKVEKEQKEEEVRAKWSVSPDFILLRKKIIV